jgi:hypothetical protein
MYPGLGGAATHIPGFCVLAAQKVATTPASLLG